MFWKPPTLQSIPSPRSSTHTSPNPATPSHFFPPAEHYYPSNPTPLVYPLQSPTTYVFWRFDESIPVHYQYPTYPYMYSSVENHFPHASMHNLDYHYPSYPTSQHIMHPSTVDYSKRMPLHSDHPRSLALLSPLSPVYPTPTASNQNTPTKSSVTPRHLNQQLHHSTSTLHVRAPGVPPPPISEKDQLDLKRIE